MHAIDVVLIVGASLLALFVFLFLAGALVHLVSLAREALRAAGRLLDFKAQVPRAAAARPAGEVAVRRIPRRGLLATLLSAPPTRREVGLGRPGWLKTAAVALGGMVVGVAAVTVADNAAWSLHTFAVPEARSAGAVAADAVVVPDTLPGAEVRLAPASSADAGLAPAAPRECRLDAGIVTDCSFN